MDREAIEHARALKRTLQAAIDSGEIASKKHLLSRAAEHGLTITRNGKDYAGFLCESGKRLRVHFNFGDHPPREPKEPRPRKPPLGGTWIYALMAHSSDGSRKACYVGQSVNLRRRFKDHFACRRTGYSSSALAEWAAAENTEIRVTVLSWVAGDQRVRTRFEGYWIRLAIMAGFETPDIHRWGNLPSTEDPVGQPDTWPTHHIIAASIPLVLAAKEKLSIRPLFSNWEAPPRDTSRQLDLNLGHD